jgi:gluconolactonase
MKRTLPMVCLFSLGLGVAAFACKSSSSGNNGNGDNGGSTDNSSGNPGGGSDPGSPPTQEELNTDPTAGLAPATPILEAGEYTDGPVWHAAMGFLFFTTPLGEGALYRMLADGRVIKVRDGSRALGTTPIGNAVHAGDVITTEAKQVVRAAADGGAPTVIAQGWAIAGGAPPPDPNSDAGPPSGNGTFDTLKSVVARKDGTLYVTDPGYFTDPVANRIYQIDPSGQVKVVESFADVPRPTGLTLSPDQKSLYVGFPNPEQGVMPFVRKYNVNDDGTVGEWLKFLEIQPEDSEPDGLTVDKVGNLYVADKAGIEVFKPDGTRWGAIGIPEKPTGIAFGGSDLKTMFITTEGVHIYTVKAKIAGVTQ